MFGGKKITSVVDFYRLWMNWNHGNSSILITAPAPIVKHGGKIDEFK
jgi:hypothetical protein